MSFLISWKDVPETADLEPVSEKFELKECADRSFSASRDDSGVQHVFVSGDNYPSMKLLLPEFSGKIDFIYIDPPYNTGKKTFTYNDSFETDSWLSFMGVASIP